jgi:hypothetical protein
LKGIVLDDETDEQAILAVMKELDEAGVPTDQIDVQGIYHTPKGTVVVFKHPEGVIPEDFTEKLNNALSNHPDFEDLEAIEPGHNFFLENFYIYNFHFNRFAQRFKIQNFFNKLLHLYP